MEILQKKIKEVMKIYQILMKCIENGDFDYDDEGYLENMKKRQL